jgi:hypothetical protein
MTQHRAETLSNCCDANSTSASGQTLPMDFAPLPPDVRCCSKSDHSRRECELTRGATNRHRAKKIFASFATDTRPFFGHGAFHQENDERHREYRDGE